MLGVVFAGIMLPFLGTAIGSSTVFIMKKNRRAAFTDCLSGFAAGVMIAASVWSLLLPSIEGSEAMGSFSFVPAAIGFIAGIVFMLFSARVIERLNCFAKERESGFITAFAVTVHNIPEGMAVGIVYASLLSGADSVATALSLSLGIAIQNIPEGAIVSLPLYTEKRGKLKAFNYGILSGIVEPLAAIGAILCVSLFSPLMPYFLSFAAGAMIFVVMDELSEEMNHGKGRGMLFFALGFVVMMSLDVAVG